MALCKCGFPSVLTTSRRNGAFLRECALGKDGCGIVGFVEDECVAPGGICLKVETMDKNKQQLIVTEPVNPMQPPGSWKDMKCCGKQCVVDKKVIRYGIGKKFCKYSPICETCGEKRSILLPVPSVKNVLMRELEVGEDEAKELIDKFIGSQKGEEELALRCKKKLIDSHLHSLDLRKL